MGAACLSIADAVNRPHNFGPFTKTGGREVPEQAANSEVKEGTNPLPDGWQAFKSMILVPTNMYRYYRNTLLNTHGKQ